MINVTLKACQMPTRQCTLPTAVCKCTMQCAICIYPMNISTFRLDGLWQLVANEGTGTNVAAVPPARLILAAHLGGVRILKPPTRQHQVLQHSAKREQHSRTLMQHSRHSVAQTQQVQHRHTFSAVVTSSLGVVCASSCAAESTPPSGAGWANTGGGSDILRKHKQTTRQWEVVHTWCIAGGKRCQWVESFDTCLGTMHNLHNKNATI